MYVCVSVWFVCHTCVGVDRSQRLSEPMELALYVVMGCLVGSGNQTLVLWKSSHCS